MPNYFSGPTLKLEFVFQFGQKEKNRNFSLCSSRSSLLRDGSFGSGYANHSLVQAAGAGQLIRYPQPATAPPPPPPPPACPLLPPPATGAAAAAWEAAKEPLPRPPTPCIASAPTPSHILPGSEVTDICVPSGPRRCRASLRTQRCPSATPLSSSAANPFAHCPS